VFALFDPHVKKAVLTPAGTWYGQGQAILERSAIRFIRISIKQLSQDGAKAKNSKGIRF